MLQRAVLGAQRLDLMLGEIADPQLRRADHLARERRELAREQLSEGRLAIAVGAEQRDPVVRVEAQIETVQHHVVAVAGGGPLERDQGRRRHLRLREAQRHVRRLDHRRDRLELRDRLEAALRLARLARLVAEAVDERLHVPAPRLELGAFLGLEVSFSRRTRSNAS